MLDTPTGEGIVYILTNESMPGYVKIGLTKGNTIHERMRSLDNTSTPLPFECFYAARVPDCRKLERTLHFVFGEKRTRTGREFFTIEPNLAKAIIELVATADATPGDAEQLITRQERQAIEEVKATKAKKRTLASVGIVPGDVLDFSKDASKTATVVSDRKVRLNDEQGVPEGPEHSVSPAALILIRAMGYNWSNVSGFDYWRHNGKLLRDLEPHQNESPDVDEG